MRIVSTGLFSLGFSYVSYGWNTRVYWGAAEEMLVRPSSALQKKTLDQWVGWLWLTHGFNMVFIWRSAGAVSTKQMLSFSMISMIYFQPMSSTYGLTCPIDDVVDWTLEITNQLAMR